MKEASTNICGKSIVAINTYISGLYSNSERKNCSAMANELGVSHDSVYRALKEIFGSCDAVKNELLDIAMPILCLPGAVFAIDGVLLCKIFAKELEGLGRHYDTVRHAHTMGYSIMVIGITFAGIFFPIDFVFWFPEELVGDKYIKKDDLLLDLVRKYRHLIGDRVLTFDGLHSHTEVMKSLIEMKIRFDARMHSNRVVEINGESAQIKEHPALKLNRNKKSVVRQCTWQGMTLQITRSKRKIKTGKVQFLSIISNYVADAKQHVQSYRQRWPIEKFFRTSKQKLGLTDCQSTSIKTQETHIFAVFLAFARMAKEALSNNIESVDECINRLRRKLKKGEIHVEHLFKTLEGNLCYA